MASNKFEKVENNDVGLFMVSLFSVNLYRKS